METIILDFADLKEGDNPYSWMAKAFHLEPDHPARLEPVLIRYPMNRKVILKNWKNLNEDLQEAVNYLESIQQHSQTFYLIYEPVEADMY